jgi:ADP-ribose pyrophosphatase
MKYGVEIIEQSVCYQGFFRLERYRLRHELFAGGWSKEIIRELLERGHAAAAVLYDPDQDKVVLIEQFRVGALGTPEGPWLLECIAGVMKPDETPAEVVHREAMEEAGCALQTLLPVMRFSLSPGGCSEEIHLFCARVDAQNVGGIHGLAEEAEDIRVCAIPFKDMLELLETGKIRNATAIIALQWLALHRDQVRAQWLGR